MFSIKMYSIYKVVQEQDLKHEYKIILTVIINY